ncbi:MAG: hypothetical protein GXY96_05920 [Tissierellia bacterium]|nr:hypothetical protein [Tissierellia bacterium]
MNLNNFEEYINDVIIDRGYSYYTSGRVMDEYERDGLYTFIVEGTYDYKVEVEIGNNGEILDSFCDCPYDFGPICKHEVAVYYYLREIVQFIPKKRNGKRLNLQDVLNRLSKEELVDIIMELTSKDRELKQTIMFKYAKEDDKHIIIDYKRLLYTLARKYLGKEDYISYNRAGYFADDMRELFINGIEKALTNNNYLLATDIALMTLEKAIEAFNYADDSDGFIGSLTTEIIEYVDDLVFEVLDNDYSDKREIFYKMIKYLDIQVLDGWNEYRVDLLNICLKFIGEKEYRKALEDKIMDFAKRERNSYYEYFKEELLLLLYGIMEKYETEDKQIQFIKENLQYTAFRELLINKLKDRGDYHKIIDLTLEGEEKDKDLPGLVNQWRKIRYEAYKKLSLKEEQEKLARKLFLEGNFEYYEELKAMHKGREKELYNEILVKIRKGRDWYWNNLYVKLIVYENDLEELLNYVKNNLHQIEEYANILFEKYPDEVIDIYKDYILSTAKAASNRSKYRNVCSIIERYSEFVSVENLKDIINKLRSLYKNRPAFLDELSKIKL